MTNIFHSILTNSSETVKQHNVAYQSSSKFEHPPRSLSPYFLAANHSQLQTLSMSKFFQKNVTFKPHHPHFRLPRSLSRSSTFLIESVDATRGSTAAQRRKKLAGWSETVGEYPRWTQIYQSKSVWISSTGLRLAARTNPGQVRLLWKDAHVCASCALSERWLGYIELDGRG